LENFTPISALIGGCLIGAAAGLLLWLDGRIAGVSGIFGGLLGAKSGDRAWRVAFLAGLVLGPALYATVVAHPIPFAVTPSIPTLVIAGLLVGFGTQLGNGCTSGHGVCGLARFSKRSLAATVSFLATAVVTVTVVRHLFGA
jgi:uncharacterized membrane protein YedE/YeeE